MSSRTSETETSTDHGPDRALRPGRLGTPGLLFSVLPASAPLMVMAAVMPAAFATVGIVGQPLIFLVLGAVSALFAVGYAELSRRVHHAGAFYAHIARGLGPTAGAAASHVALAAYTALQAGLGGLVGFEVSDLLDHRFGVTIDWWVPALLAVALAGGIARLRVDLNAKVLGALLLVEVALVLVFDGAALAQPAAERLSPHAFNPHTLARGGVGTALCLCAAAFTGFAQAPAYAEETRRPQVTVRRVLFLAVGCVTVLLVLGSWALTLAAGPQDVVDSAQKQGPGLLFALAGNTLGATFTDVLHILYVTGVFAALLAFHNVAARYAFAMGREGLLPAGFGRTRAAGGAPLAGSLLQTALSVALVAAFALTDHGPPGDPTAPVTRLCAWTGAFGALGVVLLMAAACLSVIVYFLRRGEAADQRWRLLAAGLAGFALLGIAAYTVRRLPVLIGAGPHSVAGRVLPGLLVLVLLGGLVHGLVLRARRPEAHAGIGRGNEARRPGPAPSGSRDF
ncbi:APC family permease [Streptomyces sp. ASQP_92]|uniref:APC family permease n=1 Tax=Streptomyces sp. ASQP_92 TaxID=2979116 RepID=UPI0021C0BF47|nr:APC family permease [Streptomyces sp. ASQP_92]MCT9093704.1 APC family permease [Streptomyces sp. ASQP_92]